MATVKTEKVWYDTPLYSEDEYKTVRSTLKELHDEVMKIITIDQFAKLFPLLDKTEKVLHVN